jgi:hypothetical protein
VVISSGKFSIRKWHFMETNARSTVWLYTGGMLTRKSSEETRRFPLCSEPQVLPSDTLSLYLSFSSSSSSPLPFSQLLLSLLL